MIPFKAFSWRPVLTVSCVLCLLLILASNAVEHQAAKQNFRILAKIPIPAVEMGTGITLNGALNLIYVSGGFNTGNVYVVDGYTFKRTATNPGSGASVDSTNDDYWAGGLYGGNVYIYSGSTNKLIDTLNVGDPYCPGAVQFDANSRVMWVATQCGPKNDPVFVYNADTGALVKGPIFTLSSNQGCCEIVNPVTGRYYQLDNNLGGNGDCPPLPAQCPLRIDPQNNYQVTLAAFGITMALDTVKGILYAYTVNQDGTDNLVIVNGTPNPETILKTVPLNYGLGDIAVNNALNHLYISAASGGTDDYIDVRDLNGNPITTFSLGSGNSPFALAADSLRGRLYAVVHTPNGQLLYVLEDLSTVRDFRSRGSAVIGQGHR